MNNTEWWKKDGLGDWALENLNVWKEQYREDVVLGKKSIDEVIQYFTSTFSVTEEDPKTAISKKFYELQLKDSCDESEQPFRFFWLTKDVKSEEFYDYFWENEHIWVVFGSKEYINSASALLDCKLIQYQGINQEELENNTEKAFWYFSNIDSMYRILNES